MASDRIFLSYRRTDRGDLVERLYDRLEQHFGHARVFIDVDGIPAGADFVAHIEHILGQCGLVIAVIGPRWVEELHTRSEAAGAAGQTDFVRVELERAVALGTPVLPVLLGEARMPRGLDLPDSLAPIARLQATHVRSGPDFKPDVQRLIDALEGMVGAPARNRPTAPIPGDGPRRARIAVSSSDIQENPQRLAGVRIGPYVIRRVIGVGGSGVALAATHAALAREVCVKLSFPLGERMQSLMSAVRRGMRGLVQLDHPNIARVYDFEEVDLADGWCFYVALEYVDGLTLDKWAAAVEQMSDPAERSWRQLGVARQIADGLVVAHACRYSDDAGFQITGVMHGDIKPTNIMVRANGVPVLVDFMLVDVQRHLQIQTSQPMPEGIPSTAAFGTPGFMAPEQERLGIVTPATDLYGLGRTLGYVFPRTVVEVPALYQLIMEMVSETPEARPASMQAVATALGALEHRDAGATRAPDNPGVPEAPSPGFRGLIRKVFPFRFR